MKNIIGLMVLMMGSLLAVAQEEEPEFVSPLKYQPLQNNIYVEQDPRIDTLLQRNFTNNTLRGTISGYRIQIVSSKHRENVYDMKAEFYSHFPEIETFVDYQQPNFKLRVGNYRNRLEAMHDLEQITEIYSSAFLIREQLPFEELGLETEEEEND